MSIKEKLGVYLYDRIMKGPERSGLQQWRSDLLEDARGDVLEVGIGTGANLKHYPVNVDNLIAVEPNPAMARKIDLDSFGGSGSVEVVGGVAGELPLEDESVDTVVMTLVLCSVPDVAQALAEIRRVLRPGGRFLFLEHVASCKEEVQKWQDRVDPIWNCLTGDCHMNRRTEEAIEEGGFEIRDCIREPMPKTPRLLRPSIRGVAVPFGLSEGE